MNLSFTGHHIDITPSIRGYAEKKFARISRHCNYVIDVNIIMTVEKPKQPKIEAKVHISGKDFFAKCDDEKDMYAAIDVLVDKLDRQIIEHKEITHQKRHEDVPLKHQEFLEE